MTDRAALRRTLLALGWMWAAACGAAAAAPVAYVDQLFPASAPFHIERQGRQISASTRNVDLEAGDRIFVDTREATLIVRYIADNTLEEVRQRAGRKPGEPADYVVRSSLLPGLVGVALDWIKTELSGADQRGGGEREAATRGGTLSGKCFNDTGQTDNPTLFASPILRADKSQIPADGGAVLFVSWMGGAPPYAVTLSMAETGETVAESKGITGQCWTRLPATALGVGRYRLTITDRNGTGLQENSLFVVEAAPDMPQPLRDAPVSDDVRSLYFATWLSAKNGGEWALAAEQLVARMDCNLEAAQSWLRRWGDAPPCP